MRLSFATAVPVTGLILAATLAPTVPARAAPLQPYALAQASGSAAPQAVQYRRHYGYRGWGHRHHGYGGAAALGGLAAGAIIGGAIANSQAQAADAQAYCAQRYRSYDPASGTYLNNDGNRYPCP